MARITVAARSYSAAAAAMRFVLKQQLGQQKMHARRAADPSERKSR